MEKMLSKKRALFLTVWHSLLNFKHCGQVESWFDRKFPKCKKIIVILLAFAVKGEGDRDDDRRRCFSFCCLRLAAPPRCLSHSALLSIKSKGFIRHSMACYILFFYCYLPFRATDIVAKIYPCWKKAVRQRKVAIRFVLIRTIVIVVRIQYSQNMKISIKSSTLDFQILNTVFRKKKREKHLGRKLHPSLTWKWH